MSEDAAHPVIALAALCLLLGLLVLAVISDIRCRRIPNAYCVTIAACACLWWVGMSHTPVIRIASQLLLAAAIAVPLVLLFARNLLAGGDVKLAIAVALWLRPAEALAMIVWTAILGGVVGAVVLLMQRIGRTSAMTVPYGVAIAAGTSIALSHAAGAVTRSVF
mgnify:CR=1 FL=1